jgi:hypothetical protein
MLTFSKPTVVMLGQPGMNVIADRHEVESGVFRRLSLTNQRAGVAELTHELESKSAHIPVTYSPWVGRKPAWRERNVHGVELQTYRSDGAS